MRLRVSGSVRQCVEKCDIAAVCSMMGKFMGSFPSIASKKNTVHSNIFTVGAQLPKQGSKPHLRTDHQPAK